METPRIVEVLIRYEVPLVSVAKTGTGKVYLCQNVEESEDCRDRFLVTFVRPRDLRRFVDEEVDLRFIIRRAGRHYTAKSSGEVNEVLELKRLKGSIEEYLPDPGLFLHDYHGKLRPAGSTTAPVTTRKVLIDGHWGLGDMRKFSNVLGDAYSFLFALQGDSGVNVPKLRTLFEKYPWRGGFSAVNFYEQLALIVPFTYRPAIAEIQKASPGFIDLSLHKATASQLVTLVSQISATSSEQQAVYSQVRQGLREHKWLGRSASDVSLSRDDIAFLKEQIQAMASVLHLQARIAFVNELAKNDPLAAVKILLSVYRRVKELADYLETGKAQFA